MSVPPFRPPVPKPLHPFGWLRPAGSTEFRVTQTFNQINPEISMQPHRALDMGNGHLGAEIYAPAAGVIVAEGWLLAPWSQASPLSKRTLWGPNYGGIMAVIDHGNGWVSALAHLQRTIVDKGQKVNAGQQVGNLGATGAAAEMGGHVHWDLYRNGVKVDPWPLLKQNFVVPSDTSTTSPQEDEMVFVEVERYPAPRGVRVLAGPDLPGYRPPSHTPARVAKVPNDSYFRASGEAWVTGWSTDPSNPVYEYWVAADGTFGPDNNGGQALLVPKRSKQLIPEPKPTSSGPTAEEVAALVRQGRQAGAQGAAQAAAEYAAKQ